ncbi:MAG: hypothetical protein NT026_01110 [Candidatus Staskawiczbacteria bacterium]|nr:hypothetical protein [Candidatus Staskawiczbacteria bacterium]
MSRKIILFFIVIIGLITAGIFLYNNGIFKKLPVASGPQNGEKKVLSDEELKEEIGQMIMAGFRRTEANEDSEIYKIIKDVKIGGVVLFDRDVPSASFPRNIVSPAQTKKLISDIQKYSKTPLFVAVDAEGGNINRLKEKYGFSKILSAQEMGKDKTLKTTQTESKKLAQELKNAGFNMNLAPVVDVNINPKNPIIGVFGRSFSANADEVSSNAKVFIKSHSDENIIAVAKHFPGQGSATQDSHLGITDVTNTYSQKELVPYQELVKSNLLDAVMAAHVINKNIDENYPASLSENFLQNILRKQIGFNGVIISDDLQMGAISKNYGFKEAVIRAVNAGNDILTVLNNSTEGYDKELAYETRDIIFNAVKEGKIKEGRIEESYNRIINLKKKFKIIASAQDINNKAFELLAVEKAITFKDALDMANYVAKKVEIRPAFLLAIFQEELSLEKTDMCYLTDSVKGKGIRQLDSQPRDRVMNPQRDVPGFLQITKELNKDPAKTLITCPMSFGWGGAMGPADFIPSTWLTYEKKVEEITGKPADPWNIQDAFLAAGIYLSESGASSENHDGEWKAAMIYFSGSEKSPYTWYADGALEFADKIQADIDMVESNVLNYK